MLTPLGRAVLPCGALVLSLGLWLAWQEFVVFGTVAVTLVVLGVVWVCLPGQPRAELQVGPRRVQDGGGVPTAELEVHAGALPLLGARFEVPYGATSAVVAVPFLAPFATLTRAVELPARPRGVYRAGPVRYVRADPVRLTRRGVEVSTGQTVLVRPRTRDVPGFATGLSNDLEGSASEQLSMSDLAFHALREYAPGDDLRHVHWRSSAKTSRLQVRQYHTTRRGHVTVLVDHEPASYRGSAEFELAVSIAASLALRATRDDLEVYLRCGDEVVTGRVADAVLDRTCAFTRQAGDYRAVAAAAATAVAATGLVVQVTGSGRAPSELRGAASSFHRDVSRMSVVADPSAAARSSEVRAEREVVAAGLAQLPGLLAMGRR
ncbi:DUF58 domain-containing protein [Nocardioides marinquilinus]|uniref:DUF58 domain-containing protein n=1 Tax=Nocardioides marinquilinus TaxID=1210400 RepID=UPI0031EF9600